MIRFTLLFTLLLPALAFAADAAKADAIAIDKEKRTISIAARIAPRKLPNLDQVYPLEVVATYPAPKGQKAHETIVNFDVKPSDVHKALESLGLKPGKPAVGEDASATGPELKVYLDIPAEGGSKRVAIEKCVVDKKTNKTLPNLKWHFTGSVMSRPNPDKDEEVYGADLSGTLISFFPVTNQTVLQTNLTMKEEPLLDLEVNKRVVPAEGTAVRLIIEIPT